MDFNFIIFPKPRSLISLNTVPGQTVWIPKYKPFYPFFSNYTPKLKPKLKINNLKKYTNSSLMELS